MPPHVQAAGGQLQGDGMQGRGGMPPPGKLPNPNPNPDPNPNPNPNPDPNPDPNPNPNQAAEAFALSPGAAGGGAGGFRAAAAEALRQKQSGSINPAMAPAALHLMTKKELIRLVLEV